MGISLRYGLNGGESLRQREIAQKTGISRSYVSRIEKRALLARMDIISRIHCLTAKALRRVPEGF